MNCWYEVFISINFSLLVILLFSRDVKTYKIAVFTLVHNRNRFGTKNFQEGPADPSLFQGFGGDGVEYP